MKKPNFFIIGAPKCGTTSIANWLREHTNIFMVENPKEPMFFDTDITKHNLTLKKYEKLFPCYITGCHSNRGQTIYPGPSKSSPILIP